MCITIKEGEGQGNSRGKRKNTEKSKTEPGAVPLPSFPGATVTKAHKLGGLDSRDLLSHSSGGWRSEIQVLAGPGSL